MHITLGCVASGIVSLVLKIVLIRHFFQLMPTTVATMERWSCDICSPMHKVIAFAQVGSDSRIPFPYSCILFAKCTVGLVFAWRCQRKKRDSRIRIMAISCEWYDSYWLEPFMPFFSSAQLSNTSPVSVFMHSAAATVSKGNAESLPAISFAAYCHNTYARVAFFVLTLSSNFWFSWQHILIPVKQSGFCCW